MVHFDSYMASQETVHEACLTIDRNYPHLAILTRESWALLSAEASCATATVLRTLQCRRGHEMNEKNSIVRANGRRDCRVCASIVRKRWKDAQKELQVN